MWKRPIGWVHPTQLIHLPIMWFDHCRSSTSVRVFTASSLYVTEKGTLMTVEWVGFKLTFLEKDMSRPWITINDNNMLFYSLTTMMCFLTKEWYVFSAYAVYLFIKAYHRITFKEDLKSHKSAVSLRWYAFLCGFGSGVLLTIDRLRSISFFWQNAHHDWLTKEYTSNWFLVNLIF